MTSRWQKYNQEDYFLEHENLMFVDDEDAWLDDDDMTNYHATLPSNAVFHEGPVN